ncbi:MAG: Uma2 family endonuclease [Acidobacteria bacterium]|nr:Uma2 family endonuclease [Acidobacteriota bacterium]
MAVLTRYRVSDLATLERAPGVAHFELSEGELIPVGNAGARHELIKSNVAEILTTWNAPIRLGKVLTESSFALGEEVSRQPDVAFLLRAKYLQLPDDDVPIPFAPDLAVEVISVSESALDAERKVAEYFEGGTAEVWQIYPRERFIRIRRPGLVQDVEGAQLLETPLLPGFSVPAELFFQR